MPEGTSSKRRCDRLSGEHRTLTLRLCFIVSMLTSAVIWSWLAYTITTEQEETTAIQTYESIASGALEQAQAITRRKQQGAQSLSTVLAYAFPRAEQWPFIGLRGYTQIANQIASLSASAGHGFMTIVRPEQVQEFEEHAADLYKEFEYPEAAGWKDFGFGIYGVDKEAGYEDGMFHDTSGETKWDSTHKILAPFLQHKNTFTKPSLLLRNLHQFELRGKVMDDIIDCGLAADPNATEFPNCGAVEGFTEIFVRPGPSAVFFNPVFPADNPTEVVGFIGTSMNWAEVLTNVVPDYVNGLDCVISDGTESYTYVIQEGEPVLLGEGDQHDRAFDSHGHTIVLNDDSTFVSDSTIYSLTLYATDAMIDEFHTNIPRDSAILFASVTLLCTLLFFLYDYFMQHQSYQQKRILDMKRKFVRFISHEIRTPLNVVCMGLDLLQTELRGKQNEEEEEPNKAAMTEGGESAVERKRPEKKSAIALDATSAPYLLDLTEEIRENSHNAISVLNDLLNYDKIECGTFKLALGRVDAWSAVRKTVKEFSIQARNRRIQLQLQIEGKDGELCDGMESLEGPFKDRFSIGDERRLAQVIRNLISNALKFSPENSTVSVVVFLDPNGLVSASPLHALDLRDEEETDVDINKIVSSSFRSGSIRIEVRDSGVGLSRKQMGLLFKEGVQFNPNELQHGGGSGLGLCITKEIVEMHSGEIKVDSDGIGHGSTFSIELPLYQSNDRDKDITNTEECSQASNGDDHYVLVVDDVLTNTKMLVRVLQRAGYECEVATNGLEAIEAYEKNIEDFKAGNADRRFDTILMDFEMPVMNGPEATKRLREFGCGARIFGVTGNVLAEDVATFKASGADNVLYKPINLQAVEAAWDSLDASRRR